MMKKAVVVAIVVLSAFSLYAESAKDIIDRMEDAMDFESISFSAQMTNTDRLGSTTMNFDVFQRNDGDTLLLVTSGLDKGQKTLRLGDEIYIYYPDADEVIRLSSSGLKDSFLGSDFSYEDLTGDDDYDARYVYSLTGEEEYDGVMCYRLLFEAKSLSETYQRQELLIDKERFVPLVQYLYSKSGRLLKTIEFSDYTDSIPYYPQSVKTRNAVKKSNHSELSISGIVFNGRLDDSLFDKEELAW